MDWNNKVAIITGATTGIGQATLSLLRGNGCTVYNFDKQFPSVADPFYIPCDTSQKDQVNAAVDQVMAREGRIDFLFCINAA